MFGINNGAKWLTDVKVEEGYESLSKIIKIQLCNHRRIRFVIWVIGFY
jgi:hypothetical protein